MLSAAQLVQISALLDEALELDPEARRRWLEVLPSEHHDLLPELRQALFPQERDAGATVGTLPKFDAAGGREAASGLKAGALVGPYRLIRLLGAGGMAEVWLAQRADGTLKREVALKLPMLPWSRKDLTSRFARERDILAALEHPNIARLYDAGVSAEGLPYLAMEYVHGEPLTAWCDQHQLGIAERLKLFLQVLAAVEYAHGHQVIHRDIKPSNILVTESGQARLLDFGVAKLLAREDDQGELTQLYGQALTPEYASPERARGEAIGPAADVYSLGVVLYELLTGTRPYRLKAGPSAVALEQAIATARVERPSTHVAHDAETTRGMTPEKLARRLKGDLDTIALKALAKAPEDRYRSAAALEDDLQRYLRGEPVRARPDRLIYRFAKLISRHRTEAATTVVVVLAFAAMTYELIRREAPLVRPPASAGTASGQDAAAAPGGTSGPALNPDEKSIAVLPFVDMSEKKDQEYFSDGLSEALIDSLARIPDLRVAARTSSFYFKSHFENITDIARKLRVSHVLEGSVRKSGNLIRVTAQLIRADNGFHVWSQTYERSFTDIFKVQDDIAGAVVGELKATMLSDPIVELRPANAEAYNLLLQARYSYARATEADARAAVKLLQKSLMLDPNYAPAWTLLGRVHYWVAGYVDPTPGPHITIARKSAQRALELDPKSVEAHLLLARIARTYDFDRDVAAAETEAASRLQPGSLRVREERARLAYHDGDSATAAAELAAVVDKDPLNGQARLDLGGALLRVGRFDDAQAAVRTALEISPDLIYGHLLLSRIALGRGQVDLGVLEAHEEVSELYRYDALAVAYDRAGRKAEARAQLQLLTKKYSDGAAYQIGEVYAAFGDRSSALDWLERAYRQHDAGIAYARANPLFKDLLGEPRFQVLLTKKAPQD